MRRASWSVIAWLGLAAGAAAQSSLLPGDVAVVTSSGLYLLRPPAAAVLLLPDTAFGGLAAPSVHWRPGTDELLVASGARLFDVTLAGPFVPTATLIEITPAGIAAGDLRDLDVHPVSGELFVLDGGGGQVLRYAPPFSAGMAPDLVIPLPGSGRAMTIDTTGWPPTVIVGQADSVLRFTLDGAASTLSFAGANGLDRSGQLPPITLASVSKDDLVRVLVNPNLVTELNLLFNLCGPVALGPVDVEFDAANDGALVLGEGGVNPACLPGYSGGNHVLRLPLAQAAGVPPHVLTGASSGIDGQGGDLAWVAPDLAFVSPYASASATPPVLVLAAKSDPYPGNPGFALALQSGPAGAPAFLLAGVAPLDLPLPSGAAVLVVAAQILPLGSLGVAGEAEADFALPAGLPLGLDLFVQGAVASGGVLLSNGMLLHVAP